MEEILTPSQVAAFLHIHVKTVYRLAGEGTIPGSKIGRSWRFIKKDILGLVANGAGQGEPVGGLAQPEEGAE